MGRAGEEADDAEEADGSEAEGGTKVVSPPVIWAKPGADPFGRRPFILAAAVLAAWEEERFRDRGRGG